MGELETLVGLVLAAVILTAAARRIGAPYPAFLALGGAILAFIPGAPVFRVPPNSRSRFSSHPCSSTQPLMHLRGI